MTDSQILNLDDETLDIEKEKLAGIGCLSLIEYIKTSVEILLNLKVEGRKDDLSSTTPKPLKSEDSMWFNNSMSSGYTSNMMKEPPKAYEEQLQKLESDIR